MPILAVRRWADLDAAEQARLLARSTAAIFEAGLAASIEALFEDVRARGDAAVLDATERFDGVRFDPADLRVQPEELAAAHAAADPALLAGIREAIRNSRLFNEAQVRATALGWLVEARPGFEVGEQVAPIPSAGLYVPPARGASRPCSSRSVCRPSSPACRRSPSSSRRCRAPARLIRRRSRWPTSWG